MSPRKRIEPKWLYIAVQALAVIATSEGACPSGAIAQNLAAHAVFLRRVLAQLVRAGIVEAYEGRAGGYRLARPANQVTLASILRAVQLATPAEEAAENAGPTDVETVLDEIGEEVDARVLDVLEGHTLASVMARAGGYQAAMAR